MVSVCSHCQVLAHPPQTTFHDVAASPGSPSLHRVFRLFVWLSLLMRLGTPKSGGCVAYMCIYIYIHSVCCKPKKVKDMEQNRVVLKRVSRNWFGSGGFACTNHNAFGGEGGGSKS